MSFFGFKRDEAGRLVANEQDTLQAMEVLINQLHLLNEQFREAFDTEIELDDLEELKDNEDD